MGTGKRDRGGTRGPKGACKAKAPALVPAPGPTSPTPDRPPVPHPASEAHWPLEKRAREAERFRLLAEDDRASAIECERRGEEVKAGAYAGNALYHDTLAKGYERLPAPLAQGIGGEVAAVRDQWDYQGARFKDTLERPETTSATASSARVRQAEALGPDVLTQALDAAGTIEARDSIERMAAHQLAAAHAAFMKTTARGLQLIEEAERHRSHAPHFQMLNTEGARLLGAAVKFMTAYQSGHATLVRLRQGGRQEVKVIHQHVQVTDGGQAVVTGEVAAPGGTRGEGGGR